MDIGYVFGIIVAISVGIGLGSLVYDITEIVWLSSIVGFSVLLIPLVAYFKVIRGSKNEQYKS